MNKYKVAFAIAAVTMVMGMCTGCGETTEDTAFGLQDFEGFYCMTSTEEIDGFEVTYTTGYQFNGDGTGMCYAQDVVPFTWNETEIHFGDNTENFVMEPGKLTVGDITYDKIDGKLITPNPCVVDVDNIEIAKNIREIVDEYNQTLFNNMMMANMNVMDMKENSLEKASKKLLI